MSIITSTYPILAMAMNQVSDAKFAVACAREGLYPSIGIFEYSNKVEVNYAALVNDLAMYKEAVGNSDYLFTLAAPHMHDEVVMKILQTAGVKFIEVIMPWDNYDMYQMGESLVKLKNHGFILFQRAIQYDPKQERAGRNGFWFRFFDGVIAKGNKGAGAVTNQTLPNMVASIQADYADKLIIAAGGISTKKQVTTYLNKGVIAIGIGTILAASQESRLSDAAKERLINVDFNEAKKTSYVGKNALVFKPLITDDKNYTLSLKVGIARPDLGGHIYVGEGINNVKAIRPLKDIVADLV